MVVVQFNPDGSIARLKVRLVAKGLRAFTYWKEGYWLSLDDCRKV